MNLNSLLAESSINGVDPLNGDVGVEMGMICSTGSSKTHPKLLERADFSMVFALADISSPLALIINSTGRDTIMVRVEVMVVERKNSVLCVRMGGLLHCDSGDFGVQGADEGQEAA